MHTTQCNSIERYRKYKQEVSNKQINNHLKYSIQQSVRNKY